MEDAFRTTKKATEYNGDKLARHALDLKIRQSYSEITPKRRNANLPKTLLRRWMPKLYSNSSLSLLNAPYPQKSTEKSRLLKQSRWLESKIRPSEYTPSVD